MSRSDKDKRGGHDSKYVISFTAGLTTWWKRKHHHQTRSAVREALAHGVEPEPRYKWDGEWFD